jgi:hypothetical protein
VISGPSPRRRKAIVAIDGAIALIAILLIVQMWLLSATLESYLRGHQAVVLPDAFVSGVLSLACVGLAAFARRVDRDSANPSGQV